jgi:hypothetical protein
MAIQINGTLDVRWPSLLDKRSGKLVGSVTIPYASVEEVASLLPSSRRAEGLVVYVKTMAGIEWWQYVGGIADENLVKVDFLGVGGDLSTVWKLAGNAGTNPSTDFIGTTDAQKLVIKTNGVSRFGFSEVHSELETYSTGASAPGGGFYVNAGNITNPEDVTYPGENIGISGGRTGKRALANMTSAFSNIAIGESALENITDSNSNIAVGVNAIKWNTNSSGRNTAIGAYAMENPTDNVANVAIGDDAMRWFFGHDNVGIGSYALRGEGGNTASNVIGIGSYACPSCGDNNIGIGPYAMGNAGNTAVNNISIGGNFGGPYAGIYGGASYNTVVGDNVGGEGIVGNHNCLYGEWAGNNVSGGRVYGNYNIAIGSHAAVLDVLNYSIAIGTYVNIVGANGDGQLNIGNVIYGKNLYQSSDTYSSTPTATGSIGIGVATPTARLHLPAGTAAAGTAPLKIPQGVLLTTPEDGALEYDGTHIYFTVGSTRKQLD